MKVIVAETGLCWGIELAYARIEKLAREKGSLKATHRTAGDKSIADWDPIQRIRSRDANLFEQYPGLRNVEVVDNLDGVDGGELAAIGHQGIDRVLMDEASKKGAALHDFKCPFIAKFDDTADKLAREGYDLIAFGKPKNHHSLYAKQAAEQNGRIGLIAEDVSDVTAQLHADGRKWACLAQVTGNVFVWEKFKSDLSATGVAVRFADTVCTDSHERQGGAVETARQVDTVIVVDDRGGAAVSVFEQCVAVNRRTFKYDPKSDLLPEWFEGAKAVAIVGGILVPSWILNDVAERIRTLSGSRAA
jgi:4-hydroxy-3-methylbut-2-enyl diphosphate reductase IspH